MARTVSFVALIVSILICGVVFYQVFAGFLLPLFLAALLVVIFKPLHQRVLGWVGGRDRVAAGLTTAAIVIIVIVPLSWITIIAIVQGIAVMNFDKEMVKEQVDGLRAQFDLEIPYPETMAAIGTQFESLRADVERDEIVDQNQQETRKQRVQTLLRELNTLESQLKTTLSKPTDEIDGGESQITQDQAAEALAMMPNVKNPLATIVDMQLFHGDVSYLRELREAQFAYDQMKTVILGGVVWSAIRQAANPSDIEFREFRRQIISQQKDWFLSVTGATASKTLEMLFGLFILVLSLYYFLADGPTMVKNFMHLSPLDDSYEAELIAEFAKMSRAVVLASLLTAIAQGVLAGIGFWFAGVDALLLLTVLTMVLAMIPFIGAAAVWAPVCVWLAFIEGNVLASVLLAIYGIGIISMADNVIKPLVLHGQSNMHPLLALLSVLGGVQALGPVGILVGPMVVAFLHTLLNMLHKELMVRDRNERIAGNQNNTHEDDSDVGISPVDPTS